MKLKLSLVYVIAPEHEDEFRKLIHDGQIIKAEDIMEEIRRQVAEEADLPNRPPH